MRPRSELMQRDLGSMMIGAVTRSGCPSRRPPGRARRYQGFPSHLAIAVNCRGLLLYVLHLCSLAGLFYSSNTNYSHWSGWGGCADMEGPEWILYVFPWFQSVDDGYFDRVGKSYKHTKRAAYLSNIPPSLLAFCLSSIITRLSR
jgi:hypothetical protein